MVMAAAPAEHEAPIILVLVWRRREIRAEM